jgi:hypothetical protein
MKNLTYKILIIFFALTTLKSYGQCCTHNELSPTFSFISCIKKIPRENMLDSCLIKLVIQNQVTKKTYQTIWLTTNFLIDDSAFIHCNNVRSYITGVNGGMLVADWDYGDLIVADFNFDNREDFAIKNEDGGNGGPVYFYYVQNNDSTFVQDNFLTDSLNCFPDYFNKKNNTLTTICRANSVMVTQSTYQYNATTNKWSMISTFDIDIRNKIMK